MVVPELEEAFLVEASTKEELVAIKQNVKAERKDISEVHELEELNIDKSCYRKN